jgi:hypothetical protein
LARFAEEGSIKSRPLRYFFQNEHSLAPHFCVGTVASSWSLEVRRGDKAVNLAVAVDVSPTNHALIAHSERVGGLRTGKGDRDETRLLLRSVIGAFVRFNAGSKKALSPASGKANYVAIAVDAGADGIARVEEIKVLVLRALEPCTVEIVIKVLPAEKTVVGDTVHSPAAGAGYRVTRVHGAERTVGPYPATDR